MSVNDPAHLTYTGRDVWANIVADPSKSSDECFFEATGEVGDVYLLHPLMLHSASKNLTRDIRIITNPPVSLKEPFNFDRENEKDYSLVELKTIREVGNFKGWKIKGERRGWVPERLKRAEESTYIRTPDSFLGYFGFENKCFWVISSF